MPNRRRFFKLFGSALGALSLPSASFGLGGESLRKPNVSDPFMALREDLLVPAERLYLNTGSLGPSPQPVVNAVFKAMEKLEANPVVENWGEMGQQMESVRAKVGSLLDASAEDIILTRNTTEGLSLVGQALHLQPGDEILTTTREHGGGEVGFEFMAKRDGASLRRFALPMPAKSTRQIVKAVEQALTPQTRILLLSHVNTITGLKMPFREIADLTRERNIWLIADGAQAPGLVSVSIKDLGVDAYACSGHKWLLGPKETGFLYLSKKLQAEFDTVFTSKGFKAYSASSGTRNVAQFIGLGASLDLHQELGPELIEARCRTLGKYCRQQLSGIKSLELISPSAEELSTGIVSVRLDGEKNNEVAAELRRKDIIVKVLPGINALRFSCHMFITEQDIDRLVEELKVILS